MNRTELCYWFIKGVYSTVYIINMYLEASCQAPWKLIKSTSSTYLTTKILLKTLQGHWLRKWFPNKILTAHYQAILHSTVQTPIVMPISSLGQFQLSKYRLANATCTFCQG